MPAQAFLWQWLYGIKREETKHKALQKKRLSGESASGSSSFFGVLKFDAKLLLYLPLACSNKKYSSRIFFSSLICIYRQHTRISVSLFLLFIAYQNIIFHCNIVTLFLFVFREKQHGMFFFFICWRKYVCFNSQFVILMVQYRTVHKKVCVFFVWKVFMYEMEARLKIWGTRKHSRG